eukprot:COSAG01_NODE_41991_length_444_cov_11.043478_1_plen_75_part_01
MQLARSLRAISALYLRAKAAAVDKAAAVLSGDVLRCCAELLARRWTPLKVLRLLASCYTWYSIPYTTLLRFCRAR